MKIAFVAFPAFGHLNLMSALARRLQSRGHEPLIFSSPSATPLARAAGVSFVPFAEDASLNQLIAAAFGRMSKSRGQDTFRQALAIQAPYFQAQRQELPGLFAAHGIEAVVLDDAGYYTPVIPRRGGRPTRGLNSGPWRRGPRRNL